MNVEELCRRNKIMIRCTVCFVRHCRYAAESAIEDFRVCSLHDAPQVRRLLERLQAPAAYLDIDGRPIVLPCGPLEERDFQEHTALGLLRAWEDIELGERVDALVGKPSHTHPHFDLTRDHV